MISIYRDSVEAVTELDLTRTNMDIKYRISLCTSNHRMTQKCCNWYCYISGIKLMYNALTVLKGVYCNHSKVFLNFQQQLSFVL